jgi:hypothetical protein
MAPAMAPAMAAPSPRIFVRPPPVVVPAGNGIDTALWGPHLWRALHTAAQFTDNAYQRKEWKRLLNDMKSALPCPECSAHYNAWISANPPNLPPPVTGTDLQVALSSWLLALHNDINVRNGKEPWTLEQVAATYTDKAAVRPAVAALRPYISAAFLKHFEYIV